MTLISNLLIFAIYLSPNLKEHSTNIDFNTECSIKKIKCFNDDVKIVKTGRETYNFILRDKEIVNNLNVIVYLKRGVYKIQINIDLLKMKKISIYFSPNLYTQYWNEETENNTITWQFSSKPEKLKILNKQHRNP